MGLDLGQLPPGARHLVTTPEGKARLLAGMSAGNREKTQPAPVTVIIGRDMAFHAKLPRPFPHADAKAWFGLSFDDACQVV